VDSKEKGKGNGQFLKGSNGKPIPRKEDIRRNKAGGGDGGEKSKGNEDRRVATYTILGRLYGKNKKRGENRGKTVLQEGGILEGDAPRGGN